MRGYLFLFLFLGLTLCAYAEEKFDWEGFGFRVLEEFISGGLKQDKNSSQTTPDAESSPEVIKKQPSFLPGAEGTRRRQPYTEDYERTYPPERTEISREAEKETEQTQEAKGFLLVIVIIAVSVLIITPIVLGFKAKLIFFNSYLDASLNLIPVVLVIFGFLGENELSVRSGLIFAVGYNFVQAYRLNLHRNKFINLLLGFSRLFMAFVAPAFLIFSWIVGSSRPKRMSGETDQAYEIRVREAARQDTILKTMLTLSWLFLMKALINGERVREEEDLSLFQKELEKRELERQKKDFKPVLEDKTQAYPDEESEEPALEEDVETPLEDVRKRREIGEITPEQKAAYIKGLTSGEICPQPTDLTVKGWLYRINGWGKLNITHIDPETKRKRKITKEELEKILTDSNLNELFGKWSFESLFLNKVTLFRDYVDSNGKKCREKVLIVIDLIPELKPALKAGRWWWPF